MDLHIYTKAPDLANAAATTAADLALLVAALTSTANPGSAAYNANQLTLARIQSTIPALVLEDGEPLTLTFYSSATAAVSWSGDATYTPTVALGVPTADGSEDLTSTSTFTAAGSVWTGRLSLATAALRNAMQACWATDARCCRSRSMPLVLQVRVANATSDVETFAAIPVLVQKSVL